MEQKKNDKSSQYRLIILIITFIGILLLVMQNIPTHDDYSIPYGNDLQGSVSNALLLGNGRYLGNFFGNLMSLRAAPNIIMKTVLLFAIISGTAYLTDNASILSILVCELLFLFPSFGIFSQCYVWSMGFYNYTMPVAVFLISLSLIKYLSLNNYERASKKSVAIESVVLFFLGFTQTLYSENESIVFLVSAILIYTYSRKKQEEKRQYYPKLSYVIGTTLGVAVMFFMPQLLGMGGKLSHYRSVLVPSFPLNLYAISLLNQIFTIQGFILDLWVFWIVIFVFLLFQSIQSQMGTKEYLFLLLESGKFSQNYVINIR